MKRKYKIDNVFVLYIEVFNGVIFYFNEITNNLVSFNLETRKINWSRNLKKYSIKTDQIQYFYCILNQKLTILTLNDLFSFDFNTGKLNWHISFEEDLYNPLKYKKFSHEKYDPDELEFNVKHLFIRNSKIYVIFDIELSQDSNDYVPDSSCFYCVLCLNLMNKKILWREFIQSEDTSINSCFIDSNGIYIWTGYWLFGLIEELNGERTKFKLTIDCLSMILHKGVIYAYDAKIEDSPFNIQYDSFTNNFLLFVCEDYYFNLIVFDEKFHLISSTPRSYTFPYQTPFGKTFSLNNFKYDDYNIFITENFYYLKAEHKNTKFNCFIQRYISSCFFF